MSITVEGKRHLGAAIGTNSFVESYVKRKVSGWVHEVERLSSIAVTQPHAAYAAFTQALMLAVLWRQGSMMPSPPNRTGNAIRSLSASLKVFWPVRDGKKRCLTAFSTGLSKSPMSGMVLARYVHLLV